MILCLKFNRRTVAAAVLLIGAALCGLIILLSQPDSTAVFGGEVSSKNINTTEERVEFLKKLGWEADPDSEEAREVLIPTEFSEAYLKYNELQLTQGCDLTRYAGKRARQYSYTITNYPTGEEGITANLLIYNNTVIGGDICSPKLDGFMHGIITD